MVGQGYRADLVIQGSVVYPRRRQLEKVVNLGENSWTHTKLIKPLVQMAKRLERTSGHNECCSAPSPRLVPTCNVCERHTFAKHIKQTVT